jgi:hypothetical protein
MEQKKNKIILTGLFFLLATPFFCVADSNVTDSSHFAIPSGCGVSISDSAAGDITCKGWEKGSQVSTEGIDVAACICANTCLSIPTNHYYYDNPIAKTKQTDASKITLPVVLAWNNIPGWQNDSGEYLATMDDIGVKSSITSNGFGARSYVLEIDNTDGVINDSPSLGGIFRQVLTTNEFNPTEKYYPCFFNSGRTIKWRVRPCCKEDGSYCLPEDQAPWWTFTTSYAPEPIIAKDPDWNGSNGATGVAFKGFQIKWCRVFLWNSKQWAKSYQLMATSDEKGAGTQNCHPLLISDNQCKPDDILADSRVGDVNYVIDPQDSIAKNIFPIQGRQDPALFTRDRAYVWKMKTCFDDSASSCSDWGQAWKFSTKTDPIGVPEAISPKNDPQGNQPVGLPVNLSWSIPDGANSFIYQTSFMTGDQNTAYPTAPNNGTSESLRSKFDADNLAADTQYQWKVQACSQFNSQNCDGWSNWFSFRTTGRPPKAGSLATTSGIPATFSWEAVPGAKSYKFNLGKTGTNGKTTVLNNASLLLDPKYSLGYPDIDQNQTYVWKIQTCAHADGTVCGAWSQQKTLTTQALPAMANPNPGNSSTIYADQLSQKISWNKNPGASAYHYTISLTSPSETRPCVQDKIEKTTMVTSDMVELKCLGTYQFNVQPCVDSACASVGPTSTWKFTLSQKVPANKSVFAICGASYDDPSTLWNEREACQPKHLLLLIKVALDFLLFRLSLLLLPILALVTGVIFYSQLKTPDIWEKVISAWKAIGIGYALLIFAWIIVGILLQIAGYSGLWFKIL